MVKLEVAIVLYNPVTQCGSVS